MREVEMQAGDRIRMQLYTMGYPSSQEDFTVEEFRFSLGIFLSEGHRAAGMFTPLCSMYEPGPESKEEYICNFGSYHTNEVPGWMDLPRPATSERGER